jgi:enterochelin esterase-like enzyme
MIAALAAAAVLAGWTQVGTGPDGGSVWNGRLPGDVQASTIYLPPGYSTAQRYPVLYLLHGLPGGPDEYWHSLHLALRLDDLVASGAQPFVVVTPGGPLDGEWAGSAERYLVDEVVPWVDAHLSTIRSPRGRVLEGLSAGGYGAVDIGLRHPSVFGALGSWDGYFTPFRDGPLADATRAELRSHDPLVLVRREATILRRDDTRFYVSAGGDHGDILTSGSTGFARELTQLRLPHELWLLPRGERGHFWSATVPTALRFAADAFTS